MASRLPATGGIDPVSSLYVNLNDHIVKDDVNTLKTLVRPNIPPRKLEQLNDAAAIFVNLEERGLIKRRRGGFEFLKNLLKEMGKPPLITEVEKCENQL